jgi:hypothetical protein
LFHCSCSSCPAVVCLPCCSHLARRRLDLDESLPPANLLPCWLGLAVAAIGRHDHEALGQEWPSPVDASELLWHGPCPILPWMTTRGAEALGSGSR